MATQGYANYLKHCFTGAGNKCCRLRTIAVTTAVFLPR